MSYRCVLLLTAALGIISHSAHADGVRDERPNLIGGELGGRAFIYNVGYERYFTNRIGIGIGAMGFAADGGGFGMFPLYVALIPVGDVHGLYLAGGATYAGAAGNWDEVESIWFSTLTVGYLYHSRGGFFIRPTANLIVWKGEGWIVWPGVALGGSF